MEILAWGSDNLVEITGLYNKATGETIAGAFVTATLYDDDGQEVPNVTWPIDVVAVPGAEGDYRGLIPDTADLTPDALYVIHVDVNGGPDLQLHRRIDCRCEVLRS